MSDSATLWTVACQAPLSMGFSSPEYRSGLPFSPPEGLPHPETEPASPADPALQADSSSQSHWGVPSEPLLDAKKEHNKLKRSKKKGQMTLLPSINSINLLPHAVRQLTNVPKRKWLPLRNYKVPEDTGKKPKRVIYCVRSPQDSPTLKDSPMAKIYLQWYPKVTQLDPLSFHNWKRNNMCTMLLLKGAHWKASIQSFYWRGWEEWSSRHPLTACWDQNLRLQDGQQVSSINHTVYTNHGGTPHCAYRMGKGGFNPKSRSPDAGRPSER